MDSDLIQVRAHITYNSPNNSKDSALYLLYNENTLDEQHDGRIIRNSRYITF